MCRLQYLTLNLDHGPVVIIPWSILDRLNKFRQCGNHEKESGGIFLGNRRGENLELVEATVPKSGDKNGRYFFHRLSTAHQKTADKLWVDSGFTVTYVGEWHTHPEKVPRPSAHDIREWKSKLTGYGYPLILIIIGQEKNWLGSFYLDKVSTVQWF